MLLYCCAGSREEKQYYSLFLLLLLIRRHKNITEKKPPSLKYYSLYKHWCGTVSDVNEVLQFLIRFRSVVIFLDINIYNSQQKFTVS